MGNVGTPVALVLVGLGGALGAVLRYLAGRLALLWFGGSFPWGTLAVNVLGGLAMGVLAGWLAAKGGTESLRLLLAVGVLGGFTTFSAFSLEMVLMIQRGDFSTASGYALVSVVGAVTALFVGLWLAPAFA